eukprot:scaffold13696_cov59-Phaeocystis_antarctica.AAC.4
MKGSLSGSCGGKLSKLVAATAEARVPQSLVRLRAARHPEPAVPAPRRRRGRAAALPRLRFSSKAFQGLSMPLLAC